MVDYEADSGGDDDSGMGGGLELSEEDAASEHDFDGVKEDDALGGEAPEPGGTLVGPVVSHEELKAIQTRHTWDRASLRQWLLSAFNQNMFASVPVRSGNGTEDLAVYQILKMKFKANYQKVLPAH